MYLQARHLACAHPLFKTGTGARDTLSELMSWLKSRPFKVRFLYPSLLTPLVEKVWDTSIQNWAKDTPTINSSAVLLDCCGYALKHLPSAALQETHLKTIQRAYIAPSRRKHMVPDETGHCKKCPVTEASFFHCMWDCGKIRRFWNKVLRFVSTLFSLQVPRLPAPCLLLNFSGWNLGSQADNLGPLLVIILTVAKQCILFHWIAKSVPTIQELRARLLNIVYFERQKAFPDIEKGVMLFYKKWGAYIEALPREIQDQLLGVFESTSWYLTNRVSAMSTDRSPTDI